MIAEVAITPRSSTTPSIMRGVPDAESVLDDFEDLVAEDLRGKLWPLDGPERIKFHI